MSEERKKNRSFGDYVEIIPIDGEYVAVLKQQATLRRSPLLLHGEDSCFSSEKERIQPAECPAEMLNVPPPTITAALGQCDQSIQACIGMLQRVGFLAQAGRLAQHFVVLVLLGGAFLVGYNGSAENAVANAKQNAGASVAEQVAVGNTANRPVTMPVNVPVNLSASAAEGVTIPANTEQSDILPVGVTQFAAMPAPDFQAILPSSANNINSVSDASVSDSFPRSLAPVLLDDIRAETSFQHVGSNL